MRETEIYLFDISFVILHYNAIYETINCINSIKKMIDTCKYQIVVVDNNSPNKTGKMLLEKYAKDNNVTVILSKENLGFAKGNNLGIDYVRMKFNSKYICCLNNDTILMQSNFYSCLEEIYKYSQGAVIGPKVLLKDNRIQMFNGKLEPLKEYELQLKKIKANKYQALKEFIKKIPFMYQIYLKIVKKNFNQYEKEYVNRYHEDVVLHGCCLVFTPMFFTCLKGFNSKTFLYREEELLYISLKRNNLLSVYSPNIEIKHLEDVSTDSINKTKKDKIEFVRQNQIKSTQILIDELKEGI